MQTSDLRQEVRSELVEFAWSQWAQMGLSGVVTRHDRWAADPETLLVFSLHVARRDPRLFDEILDWLRQNGRLMSLQRLRNLARDDQMSRRLADVAIAWAGRHNPQLRSWSSDGQILVEGPHEELFVADAGGLLVGEVDDQFLAHGLTRPSAEPSYKSQAPDPSAPINLSFRLRLMFGIGTRAEVIRFLLTTDHPEVSTQQVATASAFAKRNVSETLVALVEAGVIETRWRANEHIYSLDRRRWTPALGIGLRDLPDFVDWIPLLRALRLEMSWLDEDATLERSDYLRASDARQLIDGIRPDLLAAGVDVPDGRGTHGAEYWPVFVRTVQATLQMLRPAA